jgi:hypothetical protein
MFIQSQVNLASILQPTQELETTTLAAVKQAIVRVQLVQQPLKLAPTVIRISIQVIHIMDSTLKLRALHSMLVHTLILAILTQPLHLTHNTV